MAPPDVIVIGAGIIGCAIGRELARRGAGVTIFDARSIGGGATQASAGVLAPYIEAHERGPLFDLTVRSLGMYDRFVAEAAADSGIRIEYRRCGTLEIAGDSTAARELRRRTSEPGAAGAVEWLDADAVRRREPRLAESITGALLVRTHGYVAVPALTEALAWAAMKHGATIESAHRIAAVRPDGARMSVLAEDGTAWTADQAIVAAGSWSGQLGDAGALVPRVKPIRGQLLRLEWIGEPLSHVIWGSDCYVVPWENGTVLVGATVEDVGFDERTTAAGVRDLLDAVCELLPDAWRARFVEARAGLRPASADGLPVIGRSRRMPSLVYATGHYRNGVLLAPLTAQLVADLVTTGTADPLLETVRPDR